MKTFRSFNGQFGRVFMAVAVMFGMVAPALVPAVTLAAQVTERSIELSSATVSATNVTYKVKFNSVGAAAAFVVDFCGGSPIVGQACTTPAGMSTASATTATANYTAANLGGHAVLVTSAIGAASPVELEITGITNPSADGQIYARIVTFADAGDAGDYTSTTPGDYEDDGSVALYYHDNINVSGRVMESMVFCISKDDITGPGCTGDALTAPNLELGETAGSTKALNAGFISTDTMYTQISTNAVGGAVINLKSSATCGGLKRASVATCDIPATLTSDITAGVAAFGVKTAAATGVGAGANGTLAPVTGSGYNNTTYALNWVSGNATGVASTYGDPFLDTAGAPVNNQNMQLTFGATVSNNTPAGEYSADLSMIATGKF